METAVTSDRTFDTFVRNSSPTSSSFGRELLCDVSENIESMFIKNKTKQNKLESVTKTTYSN